MRLVDRHPLALLLAALPLAASCDAVPIGAMALYDNTATRSDFFAMPWPDDSRLVMGADGKKHVDLTGFHDSQQMVEAQMLQVIEAEPLDGFGTESSIYFRFDAPIDPSSLPSTLAQSFMPGASVFVVDVTPGSPDYQKHLPMRMKFTHYPPGDRGLYIEDNWLAIRPEPGFPLREKTTYAAVVTDGVRAADGTAVRADLRFPGLSATLPLGLADGQKVVSGAVFTTGDFTPVMAQLRDAVYQVDAPQISNLAYIGPDKQKRYDQYEGVYPSPNFQEGDPPYMTTGGNLHRDPATGQFVPVRTEMLRVAMTIPKTTMPATGWPIILYAHGTGGDYHTFIHDGSALHAAQILDEKANVLTHMAMISIDQVLHGTRAPADTNYDLAFYNFFNAVAGHSNAKQGALDDYQLLRLVKGMNVAAAPGTGNPIQFNPDRIYFLGHSQGSQTGMLFIAAEPEVKAAVLSGAGANLTLAVLYKTKPSNLLADVEILINETVDEFHPMLSLIQMYMESDDPSNYARHYYNEPVAGMAPKSVYLSYGIVDNYVPSQTIEALAVSIGLQPVNPLVRPVTDLGLRGLSWANPTVQLNMANASVTGVMCEYQVPLNQTGAPAYDGHFVVMDHPAAILQANAFLGWHAVSGTAKLIPYIN